MDLSNKKLRADIIEEALKRHLDSELLSDCVNKIVVEQFKEAFINKFGLIRCTAYDRDSLIKEINTVVNMIVDQLDTLIDKMLNDED